MSKFEGVVNVVTLCIGVSTPPHLKNTTSYFSLSTLLNLQTAHAPPLGTSLLYIGFENPPLKSHFSVNHHNIKTFSSLTPSHLLKVTKFLVKMSYFNSYDRKITFLFINFLSLNIPDFSLFFM